jgi:hypothetical protein
MVHQWFCILLVIGLIGLSCNKDDGNAGCLTGNGDLVTADYTFPNFTTLDARIAGNVYLSQGSTSSLRIESHKNVLDELQVTVVDDIMIMKFDRCLEDIEPFDVYLTIPEFDHLLFAGAVNLHAQNAWNLDELTIVADGAIEMNLLGRVDVLTITLAGAADINAYPMDTKECYLAIAGAANVEVSVSDILHVTISGTGTVRYKGDPVVTSNISGTGEVVKVD